MIAKPPAKRPAQMSDVARRAGVSITTVSHVLNKTRPVAPATVERVLAAMDELRYYRNAGAQLLRGRSDSYGLIISDVENPFFPPLIKSFERAAARRGFEILLCSTSYDAGQERAAVRRMLENRVRGVAIMTSQIGGESIEELSAHGIPLVRLDAGSVGPAYSNIRVDYSGGAAAVARHLHDLGHRSAAFLAGPESRLSAVNYRVALTEGLARLGILCTPVIPGENTVEGGIARARQLIGDRELPTCVITGNDLAAIGAMRTFMEAGIRVPQDISVIGGDDIAFVAYANPPLTTIRVARDRLGDMAFQVLDKMSIGRRRKPVECVLETELVIRQSTGPARTARLAVRGPDSIQPRS